MRAFFAGLRRTNGSRFVSVVSVLLVKQLRAEHDVDAAIGERKGERASTHGHVHAMTRRGDEGEGSVQRDGTQREATSSRDLAGAPGKVGEPRADVQQGCWWLVIGGW